MPVHFIKLKKRWEFTFNRLIDGERQRATKLLPAGWSRAQAQAYDQTETLRLITPAASRPAERRTIDDAVKIYCIEVLPGLKNHKGQLRELNNCSWAYAGRYIDELPEVANFYRDNAINEKKKDGTMLAPASIRNRLAYLRAACRYAFKKHKMCEHDPAERLVMPTVKNERHFYADRKQLLQIARKIKSFPARAAVLVAFYSGMRISEITRCYVANGTFVLEDTKNGNRRVVPIHYRLNTYLHRFPMQIVKRTVQKHFSLACDELGLGHLHLHDMRHSAASEMINAGVPLNTVGDVLGHVSSESTKRYAHLQTESLTDAVALIGRRKVAR